MKRITISNLRGAFEHVGMKLIKGYSALKTNEIGYEFAEKNMVQFRYQACDHTKVIELIVAIKILNPETECPCSRRTPALTRT